MVLIRVEARMNVQDQDMVVIARDLVRYAVDLLQQGTDEENDAKLQLGKILRIVASAVQEDQVESLARQISGWSKGNLDGWKVK
jgi:hypothetical protein